MSKLKRFWFFYHQHGFRFSFAWLCSGLPRKQDILDYAYTCCWVWCVALSILVYMGAFE